MADAPPADNEPGLGRAARVLVVLGGLAIISGVLIGFIGGAFRWLLLHAAAFREQLSTWAHTVPFGWVAVIGFCAAGAIVAILLVRLSPESAGSGIQDVEAVYRQQLPSPPLSVVPVRFAGGLAAIGSGMVLGREGPTVHMGAALGAGVGKAAGLDADDHRLLQTAMSGAGLAVAFNAPVGGALFVIEEVTKSASYRLIVPTVLGVGAAIACARLVIGDHPDFLVHHVPNPPMYTLPMFLVFGVLLGLLGAAYNALVVGLVNLDAALSRVPAVVRAGVVGALIGLALFVDPLTVGGGDALTQLLLTGQAFAPPLLLMYLLIRFVAGPLSYAAGTPGGLFAPLLAVGALLGTIFGQIVLVMAPSLGADFLIAMAIVGMSTMFGATVRAPLTGIVLIVEMTAVTTVTVPMLLAAGAAVVTAMLVKSAPVYDSLREITLRARS
ncbi:H(+)/Cl(-) exchange transporter ClcA [Microbacterium aoyamense]|uniref:H(+)/Cl(-) exchange transporter ClcA n=1 Tax=Microbacterium aoyamense TaxID=344166 RepID=A0ABP5B2T2_9MICO|nr:ClC family H(+)/Cl(-) exchange transporter [Microbacterium aoyamense]